MSGHRLETPLDAVVFRPLTRGLLEFSGVVLVGVFGTLLGALVAWSAISRGRYSVGSFAGIAVFVVPSLALVVGPILYFVRTRVTVTDSFIAKRYPFGFVRVCRISTLRSDSYSMDFTETSSFLLGKREIHRFDDGGGKVRFKLGTNWWPVEEILASARSGADSDQQPR